MPLDAFTRELGTQQGRIAPTGATAEGDYVFCLGFDTPEHTEQLAEGNYVQVSQSVTFTAGTKLLRASCTLRPPATAPTGLDWYFIVFIDGVEYVRQKLEAGSRTRTRSFACNISKLAGGAHTLAFRLLFGDNGTIQPASIGSGSAFGSPTVTL